MYNSSPAVTSSLTVLGGLFVIALGCVGCVSIADTSWEDLPGSYYRMVGADVDGNGTIDVSVLTSTLGVSFMEGSLWSFSGHTDYVLDPSPHSSILCDRSRFTVDIDEVPAVEQIAWTRRRCLLEETSYTHYYGKAPRRTGRSIGPMANDDSVRIAITLVDRTVYEISLFRAGRLGLSFGIATAIGQRE